jgi:manganese/zinc/iron transport system permease protein
MTAPQIEIQLIAAVVAAACALPGAFLVLRRMALISDAISHAMLLGIVVGFFLTEDLNSPLLILGATLTGLVTALLVELLHRTGLVREDAAIGLVFPALFSIGVILISRYAGSVHLDTDVVLLGELAFAPFDRVVVAGWDIGPKGLYAGSIILLINAALAALFYKELKLATFDPGLAAALGFSPAAIHYGLMGVTSLTAVGAFDSVGAILTVALFIAPAAAAYLLTDDLARMLLLSVGLGIAAALTGYWMAFLLDASIAGSMATMAGVIFGLAWCFAPERGLVAAARRRARQRWEFAQRMLAIHLLNHERQPGAEPELQVEHLWQELRWDREFATRVVSLAEDRGLITRQNGRLELTDRGRLLAQEALLA